MKHSNLYFIDIEMFTFAHNFEDIDILRIFVYILTI